MSLTVRRRIERLATDEGRALREAIERAVSTLERGLGKTTGEGLQRSIKSALKDLRPLLDSVRAEPGRREP